MSTLMNYTYQSFNFRGRQKVKPFYDLIANIATEEYGHIELVSAVINGLLTGAERGEDITDSPLKSLKNEAGLRHHWINSGSARCRSTRSARARGHPPAVDRHASARRHPARGDRRAAGDGRPGRPARVPGRLVVRAPSR
jgi:hypothetical protein